MLHVLFEGEKACNVGGNDRVSHVDQQGRCDYGPVESTRHAHGLFSPSPVNKDSPDPDARASSTSLLDLPRPRLSSVKTWLTTGRRRDPG
jgi:hypothetical protein